MARLLLLADSNYVDNIGVYKGRLIKNLEVKSCQNKKTLLAEMSRMEEGILVIACLDLLAAEAAATMKDTPDRAVECHFNHIFVKIMDLIEENDGKLGCGIMSPIYWAEHSDETRRGLAHSVKMFKNSPVPNIYVSAPMSNLKAGGDRVHLIPQSAERYIGLIHDMFEKINTTMGGDLVEFEEQPTLTGEEALNWANDTPMEHDGILLTSPDEGSLPERTLSNVSVSMLANAASVPPRAVAPPEQSPIAHRIAPPTAPTATQERLMNMASGMYSNPPPVTLPTMSIPPPSAWPTFLPTELYENLGRIERRVGAIEAGRFFDHLAMATMKEEHDTAANRAMLNRLTIIGIRIPNLHRLTGDDKNNTMRKAVQELFDALAERDQKFEAGFVRHQNRQRRGQQATVIEVRVKDEKMGSEIRANFIKKRNGSNLAGINVLPTVRLATRVRIEMLQAIGNKMAEKDRTITRVQCAQFLPKPVLRIYRKDSGGNEVVRVMTFTDAIVWAKEHHPEVKVNFSRAYERAGSSFRGLLAQSFVLLD